MAGLIRLLVATTLGLALSGAPVAAQDIRINPVPPHVRPQWTQVPNAPGVYYAPNLPTDVFRRGSKYYFYWQGYLYRGNKAKGPWKSVTKVPAWFSEIDPSYFKTAKKEAPTPPPVLPGGPPGAPEGGVPIPPAPAPPKIAPPGPAPAPEKEEAPAASAGPKVM